jgi:uncharacterized membrane protein
MGKATKRRRQYAQEPDWDAELARFWEKVWEKVDQELARHPTERPGK